MAKPRNILFGVLLLSVLFSLMPILALAFEQDTEIDLTFPCTYNGTICELTTQCNISVLYPNGSKMVENQEATYEGTGIANYTIPDSSINGNYKVPLSCTFPDGNSEEGNADFKITPNGEEPDLAKTIIYLALIGMIFCLFLLCVWGLFKINDLGWRTGLLAFTYILINGFLLMCWKSAELFLTSIPFIEIVFKILYIVSNIAYFPVFLLLVTYLLIKLTDEKNINTLVARGYDEDLAKRIGSRRRR